MIKAVFLSMILFFGFIFFIFVYALINDGRNLK